jgi:dolichol-phosphate mannosyltransferase
VFRALANMAKGQDDIGGGLFLANRRVLDAFRRFPERNRNIVGILLWSGFKQGRMVYQPSARKFGSSKWSLAKKVRLAIDTFVAFSNRPIRLIFGSGGASAALGLVALAAAVVDTARDGGPSKAGIMAWALGGIALCIGVQLLAMGLLGEYLWRTLDEGRRRPLYVLAEELGIDGRPTAS